MTATKTSDDESGLTQVILDYNNSLHELMVAVAKKAQAEGWDLAKFQEQSADYFPRESH